MKYKYDTIKEYYDTSQCKKNKKWSHWAVKVLLPSDKFRARRYLTEAEGSSCFNSFSNLFNSLKYSGKLNSSG